MVEEDEKDSAMLRGPSEEGDAAALRELLEGSGGELQRVTDEFVSLVKRRRFTSSLQVAQGTLKLVRQVVSAGTWSSPRGLLQVVRALGRRLVRARPAELVVGNVFRRVIHMIREEVLEALKRKSESDPQPQQGAKQSPSPTPTPPQQQQQQSGGEEDLLPSREAGFYDFGSEAIRAKAGWDVGAGVVDAITEMLAELENLGEPISKQALDHIHSDDAVLAFGMSESVFVFLKAASRKRRFRVIVAEAGPEFPGHRMAARLAALGVQTTVIPDNAIFAMMARVNKVIVGTHAVMANGGLMAASGTNLVALAAKHHAVPLVCVTGLYKLTPLFPRDSDEFVDLKTPGLTASYAELGAASRNVQVIAPSLDYVAPHLVSIFVTNTGGHQPSYIYRLLAEYYDIQAEDEL